MAPKIRIVQGGGTTWVYNTPTHDRSYNVRPDGDVIASMQTVNLYCQSVGVRLDYDVYRVLGTEADLNEFNAACIGIAWNADNTPRAILQLERTWTGSAGTYPNEAHQVTLLGGHNAAKGWWQANALTAFGFGSFWFEVVTPKTLTVDNRQSPVAAEVSGAISANVEAGTQKTLQVDSGSSVTVSHASTASSAKSFVRWTTSTAASSPSASFTITVADSMTVTSNWAVTQMDFTVSAPSKSAIAYTVGINGSVYASGSVSAGSSKLIHVDFEAGQSVTLVLEASAFDYRTFQGWTQDGTVIDRWSNPATVIATNGATYSCTIGPGTSTTGALLCDRYGNLIYADVINPSGSVGISVHAAFAASTTHNMTLTIQPIGGSTTTRTKSGITFDYTGTVPLPAAGHNTGQLIYADGITPNVRLIRIEFHCQNAAHMYDIDVTVGTTHETFSDISGTFSKTYEV